MKVQEIGAMLQLHARKLSRLDGAILFTAFDAHANSQKSGLPRTIALLLPWPADDGSN